MTETADGHLWMIRPLSESHTLCVNAFLPVAFWLRAELLIPLHARESEYVNSAPD